MSAVAQAASASANELESPNGDTAAESETNLSFQIEPDGSATFTKDDGSVVLVPKKYVEIIQSFKSTGELSFKNGSPCVAKSVK